MISALDTHEAVKSLTAGGFTDIHAEVLTGAVTHAVDMSANLHRKSKISVFVLGSAVIGAALVVLWLEAVWRHCL